MAGPHPAVAAVRLAVRRGLAGLPPGALVLAACSGGADSRARPAARAFAAPRRGLRAGGITVDHGLQAGSAEQAVRVTTVLAQLGLDPVRAGRVTGAPPRAGGGPPRPPRGGAWPRCARSASRSPGPARAAPTPARRPPRGPPGTPRWTRPRGMR